MSTTAFERAWEIVKVVEREGTSRVRIDADLDAYVTCTNPDGLPGLQIDLDSGTEIDLGGVRGSDRIVLERLHFGVRLAATHPDAAEVFLAVAPDIVEHFTEAPDEAGAAEAMAHRFSHWQRLLRRSSGRLLSPLRQLGLYGELVTLRDLVLSALPAAAAIDAWTGPEGSPQDFQASGIGVEVKAIAHSEPQKLVIDGERQLDPTGLAALVIAHHRVLRHRSSGQTLLAIIDEIRDAIGESAGIQGRFIDSLAAAGYYDDDADEYTEFGFTVTETRTYRVGNGFPKLTEADLPDGLGGLTYSVDASACVPFEVDQSDVASWLSDPAGIPTV